MSYFASVAGLQIVGGSLLIPENGPWTADLHLAGSGSIPTGPVQVTIGNLTLTGTSYRWASYGGQTRARLVGGAGGWRTPIAAQGYGSNAGVQLSLVLGDAATACGETVNVPASTSVGNGYARMAFATSVAGDVLWQAYSQGLIPGWYVDAAGVTQATSWPATTITTSFVPTDQRPDEGIVVVATEDYASWMPGASFSHPILQGSFTVAGLNYTWDESGKLRFEVLTTSGGDYLATLGAIVDHKTAPLRFFGRYHYTISNPTLTTVDLTPYNSKLGLPELQAQPLTSDSIATYVPPDGGDAHVMFLDGDPGQPIVVWTSGTATVVNVLGGDNPVARLGDQTQSFLPPTLLLTLTGTVSGAPFVGEGVVEIPIPISGVITEGSPIVNAA